MNKPQQRQEVAVSGFGKKVGIIHFYASRDAAEDFATFGRIHKDEGSEQYTLFMDARFDFDEVLTYIQNYNAAATE